MPLISVVIPLYNKASYIEKSICSILNQTFDDYEIVIVDDGSTDNSVSIIENKFLLNKIRIIKKENGGPSSARNRGIIEAKGEWIVFLDADDLLLPWALEHFFDLIKKHQGINYFVCNYFISNGGIISLASIRKLNTLLKRPFMLEFFGDFTERAGSSILNKRMLMNFSFNESLRRYEDAEWLYRILNHEKVFINHIPVTIYNVDSACASNIRDNIEEDFLAHLNFNKKSFWERMMLYKLALEAKTSYKEKAVPLYNLQYKRLDYLFFYKIYQLYDIIKHIYSKYIINNKYDMNRILTKKSYFDI